MRFKLSDRDGYSIMKYYRFKVLDDGATCVNKHFIKKKQNQHPWAARNEWNSVQGCHLYTQYNHSTTKEDGEISVSIDSNPNPEHQTITSVGAQFADVASLTWSSRGTTDLLLLAVCM